MVRIKIGDVYRAERVRSGVSNNGDWKFVVVKENKDELVMWLTNTDVLINEGGQFRIKSVDAVTKKRVPYKEGKVCKDRTDKNVEWRSDVDVNVTIETVGFDQAPFDFNDMPFEMDDSNPFDDLPL